MAAQQDNRSDLAVLASTLLKNRGKADNPQLEKIKQVLNTPEGRQLLLKLSGGGGDALKKAAAAAAGGNTDPVRTLVAGLMTTKDGINLLRQVTDLVQREDL